MAAILVTGASGFIGGHLTSALVDQGHHVRCLARATSKREHLESLDVEMITGDLMDQASLAPAVRGIELVFHLGGLTSAIHSHDLMQVNGQGTRNVAQACVEFEPGLEDDFPEMLDRLIPPSRDYGHEQTWHDGNGHSHLQASLLGPSLSIPIAQNRLVLGTWQQIFHLEFDNKPREREVVVTIMGE